MLDKWFPLIDVHSIVYATTHATIVLAKLREEQAPTSAPAEFGGQIHNVLRNRALAQVLPQAQKLHVYGSGTFGALGVCVHPGRGCTSRFLFLCVFLGNSDPSRRAAEPPSRWAYGRISQFQFSKCQITPDRPIPCFAPCFASKTLAPTSICVPNASLSLTIG